MHRKPHALIAMSRQSRPKALLEPWKFVLVLANAGCGAEETGTGRCKHG